MAMTVFTAPYNKNESLEKRVAEKLGRKMEKEMMKMQNEMKRLIKSKEQGEDNNQNDERGDEEEIMDGVCHHFPELKEEDCTYKQVLPPR